MVEVITVAVIMGLMVTLAVPSFLSLYNGNRLSSAANDLVAAMQMARLEAVRSNAPAVMCQSSDMTTCSSNATWSGWLVYVDRNFDLVLDNGERVQSGALEAPLVVRTSPAITNARVVFRPDGLARSTGDTLLRAAFGVCVASTQPTENQRVVAIRGGSMTSVTRESTAAVCTAAPANPT